MREKGVVFKRLKGDPDIVQSYVGVARTLLGRMKAYLGAGVSGAKQWVLDNGVVIRTRVAGALDIVEIDVRRAAEEIEKFIAFVCFPRSVDHPIGYSNPAPATPDYKDVMLRPGGQGYKAYLAPGHTPLDAPEEFSPRFYKDPPLEYGNVDWRGKNKQVLTWWGFPNRYLDAYIILNRLTGLPAYTASYAGSLHREGPSLDFDPVFRQVIDVFGSVSNPTPASGGMVSILTRALFDGRYPVTGLTVGKYISGACIGEYDDPTEGTKTKLVTVVVTTAGYNNSAVIEEQVVIYDYSAKTRIASNPVTALAMNWGNIQPLTNVSPWLFNSSGTVGVCNRIVDGEPPESRVHAMRLVLDLADNAATLEDDGQAAFNTLTQETTQNSTESSFTSHQPCAEEEITLYYISSAVDTSEETTEVKVLIRDFRNDDLISGELFYKSIFGSTYNFSAEVGVIPSVCNAGEPDEFVDNVPYVVSHSRQVSHVASAQFKITAGAVVVFDRTETQNSSADETISADTISVSGEGSGTNINTAVLNLIALDLRAPVALINFCWREGDFSFSASGPTGPTLPSTGTVDFGVNYEDILVGGAGVLKQHSGGFEYSVVDNSDYPMDEGYQVYMPVTETPSGGSSSSSLLETPGPTTNGIFLGSGFQTFNNLSWIEVKEDEPDRIFASWPMFFGCNDLTLNASASAGLGETEASHAKSGFDTGQYLSPPPDDADPSVEVGLVGDKPKFWPIIVVTDVDRRRLV